MTESDKLLHPVEEHPIHLSHFMHLVSAYESTPERVAVLWDDLRTAQGEARAKGRCEIVDQDSSDFFFVVHPSGRVTLAAALRLFELRGPERT